MEQIVVDRTLIKYTDQGKGTVLLCVHGWMHSGDGFKNLAEELQKDFRIIALDLPNFGASEINDKIISLDDYADFLAAFIKKLDISEYVYVGHSMGGQIGIRGVAAGILQPTRLILIGSAGIRDVKQGQKKLLKIMSKAAGRFTPQRFKSKFYETIGSDYNPNLSDVHKTIIQKTLDTDVQTDAKNIAADTLLIYGSKDTSTPLWMGEKLQSLIPNSKLETVPGGDHWVHQTSASEVADRVRAFIA